MILFAMKSLFPHISDTPNPVRTDLVVKPTEKAFLLQAPSAEHQEKEAWQLFSYLLREGLD